MENKYLYYKVSKDKIQGSAEFIYEKIDNSEYKMIYDIDPNGNIPWEKNRIWYVSENQVEWLEKNSHILKNYEIIKYKLLGYI